MECSKAVKQPLLPGFLASSAQFHWNKNQGYIITFYKKWIST
jgi:hypothetical protein